MSKPEQWGGRKVMALRAQWQPRVSAGDVVCGKCGLPIDPRAPWKLGHLVDRALGGTAAHGLHPEHAFCSDRSGGQLAQAMRRASTRGRTVPTQRRRSWT